MYVRRLRALLICVSHAWLAAMAFDARAGETEMSMGGRNVLVHVPSRLPASGTRALVVVLHGGLGNAQRIVSQQSEAGLNLDAVSDANGFVVAYLNVTTATRRFNSSMLAWNAGGGCCGLPAETEVDDVAYIRAVVADLVGRYGIDPRRVFGIGHSNGAMMTARVLCETSLYAAGITISGPLNLPTDQCPGARGERILALHGAIDENVPLAGGTGTRGISRATYNSQERTAAVFRNSGASFQLQVVPGADHALDDIAAALRQAEGQSIGEKAAGFFGLRGPAS